MAKRRDGFVRSLDEHARAQGWTIEHLSRGHLRYVPPDRSKPAVIASSTPSTCQGIRNLVADLRRSGLVLGARTRKQNQNDNHARTQEPSTTIANTEKPSMDTSDMSRKVAPQTEPPHQFPPAPPTSVGEPSSFAAAFREARSRHGNTHGEVAAFVGTAIHVVRKWESGTVPQRRHYDELLRLYSELATIERPRHVRTASTASPRLGPDSTIGPLVQGLRLLREVRRLRSVLVPILEAAVQEQVEVSDLLEMAR